ncbi:Aldehyde dehydrogenase family protein [Prauserella aidingensis]|nr:Aldehyde dehydrogenase family protein [Prauserella aidingensis]
MLGDPNEPATEMGPVANAAQYEKVSGYLDRAKAEGGVVAPDVPSVATRPRGSGARTASTPFDPYLEYKSVWVELTGSTRDPFTLGSNPSPSVIHRNWAEACREHLGAEVASIIWR